MEKLQKKGVLISSNYIKKDSKEFYIVTILIDGCTNLTKVFTNKETYEKYKTRERFSPLLVYLDLNLDTNKIYYSL